MSTLTVSSPIIPANNTQPFIPDGALARREIKNGKHVLTFQTEKPITYWIAFPSKPNSDFTGILAFEIQDLFLNLVDAETLKGGERTFSPFRASIFKGISSATHSPEQINEMIKTKHLTLFHFASGILKEVWIHEGFVAKMEDNAVSEIALDNGAAYSHIKEDVDLTVLTDGVYSKIITNLL